MDEIKMRSSLLSSFDQRHCGILALLLYLANLFSSMPPVGDAADYAALIRAGEFGVRTPHIGYYVSSFPFAAIARELGSSVTTTLAALSAVCTALTIWIAGRFYEDLGLDRATSNIASLILGSTGIVWYHAEFGELQALLMLSMISSLMAFERGRPILAAAICAFALLTSQATATIGLCFLIMAYWRRSWSLLIRFSLAFLVFFGIGLAPIANDYLFGPRGLFPSMDYYQSAPFWKMLVYFGYRMFENQGVWLPFILMGGLNCFVPERRILILLVAALSIPLAWVNLKLSHIEYGFAWMPIFFVTSPLAAVGACETWRRLRFSTGVGLAATGLILAGWGVCTFHFYIQPKREDAQALTELIRATARTTRSGRVVASPYVGFVYVYETAPDVANVWEANWTSWPSSSEGWAKLDFRKDPIFILTSKAHTHAFRKWLFEWGGPAMGLSPAQVRDYMLEGDSPPIDDARAHIPPGYALRLVAERGGTSLYRAESTDDGPR